MEELGKIVGNSPTDKSHKARRTHVETKFIAKGTYRALFFSFLRVSNLHGLDMDSTLTNV
jgi:hypothetical protein